MRILFLGDVVGRRACESIYAGLSHWRKHDALDFVIINAENAAAGFGITPKIAEAFFDAGADVLTTGNHIWNDSSILSMLSDEARLLRPLNYPSTAPGRGSHLYDVSAGRVLVVNVLGQIFMESVDDPFAAIDQILNLCPLGQEADAIIVDIHAEATSEKMAMGHFCDGRASLVIGTHTHVPTADGRILESGTAFQTDAGMCGAYESMIGMDIDEPLYRFTNKRRRGRMVASEGVPSIYGVIVETKGSGLAQSIVPFVQKG